MSSWLHSTTIICLRQWQFEDYFCRICVRVPAPGVDCVSGENLSSNNLKMWYCFRFWEGKIKWNPHKYLYFADPQDLPETIAASGINRRVRKSNFSLSTCQTCIKWKYHQPKLHVYYFHIFIWSPFYISRFLIPSWKRKKNSVFLWVMSRSVGQNAWMKQDLSAGTRKYKDIISSCKDDLSSRISLNEHRGTKQ